MKILHTEVSLTATATLTAAAPARRTAAAAAVRGTAATAAALQRAPALWGATATAGTARVRLFPTATTTERTASPESKMQGREEPAAAASRSSQTPHAAAL